MQEWGQVHMIWKTWFQSVWYFYFRDRLKARERCSGERWIRRARLERCLVKLVDNIFNISREWRREHRRQFSCIVRGRQNRGFSSTKKFIHGGVEFVGWRRVNDAVVTVFGFGGGNTFLDSFCFVFCFDKFVCGQWVSWSTIDVLPADTCAWPDWFQACTKVRTDGWAGDVW